MRNSGGRRGGSGPEQSSTKASRFKPPDTARVPALQLVVYELLSLLRESSEPQVSERLLSLQRRIPIITSEVDVAQAVAELDEEEIEDGIPPTRP